MYAVIETGGKQYRVEKGDVIDVELLNDAKDGSYTFQNILFLQDSEKRGSGVVTAEILGTHRGPKVVAYKYKKRKNYRRKVGHRQTYSRVRITEIKA